MKSYLYFFIAASSASYFERLLHRGDDGGAIAAAATSDRHLRRNEVLVAILQLGEEVAGHDFGATVAGCRVENFSAQLRKTLQRVAQRRQLFRRRILVDHRGPDADHGQLFAARGNRAFDESTRL
jgi:hypothetical protein